MHPCNSVVTRCAISHWAVTQWDDNVKLDTATSPSRGLEASFDRWVPPPPKKSTGMRYPTKSMGLGKCFFYGVKKHGVDFGYLFIRQISGNWSGNMSLVVVGDHFLAEKKYPPKPGIWFPQTAPQTAQHQLLLPRTLERVSVPEIPVTPVVSLAMMTFRKGCELCKDVMKLPRFFFSRCIDQKGGSSGHFLLAEFFYPPIRHRFVCGLPNLQNSKSPKFFSEQNGPGQKQNKNKGIFHGAPPFNPFNEVSVVFFAQKKRCWLSLARVEISRCLDVYLQQLLLQLNWWTKNLRWKLSTTKRLPN